MEQARLIDKLTFVLEASSGTSNKNRSALIHAFCCLTRWHDSHGTSCLVICKVMYLDA